MILYTMMPEELIFPQVEATPLGRKIIDQNGISMEVEAFGEGYRVVRLLSTDPAHYMDGRWAPGTKISL
ncbi:YlzJ-like family protein [Bacillus sp. FJAT-27445]|uniref:YlzJ-like family protein n=1 Tax=Bacillus sp. FJAT-27445 TaxID=1679166 RepID=UPI0007434B11|nr:YlzJ-like family protein [Bacillus sp. FJAT-27445]